MANPAGSNVVSVPIVVNGPPVAALTITPNPVGANTPVTLNASASTDPNGDALRYSWDLNGDKTYGDATGAIQTRTFTSPGTFRVGVRVSDPGGSSNDAVDFVTVLQDKPPVVNFSASPAAPAVGTSVTFTATASDPDGTVAAIDWDIDGDGQFNDGTGAVVTRSFGAPGSRIVSVRATDNAGVATIAFRTIEVTGSTSGSSQGQPGPAAAAGGAPTSSASSAKQLAMLTPFPIVRIRGVIHRASARLSLLSIKAPQGARVKVICHGGGCPKKKSVVLRVASGKSSVRVRSLERRLRSGAVIEVFVTAPRADRQVHEDHDPRERRARPRRSLPEAGQVEAHRVPVRSARWSVPRPPRPETRAVRTSRLIVPAAQLGEQELRVHRADEVAQRLGARRDDLHRALDLDLAGEPIEQRPDLLLHERLERIAVAQGVEDREPELLVVAARPEAARSPR